MYFLAERRQRNEAIVLFDQVAMLRKPAGKFGPSHNMDSKQPLALVLHCDCSGVILNFPIVRSRCRNGQRAKGRLKILGLRYLLIEISCLERSRRPRPTTFALHAGDTTRCKRPIDIDSILTLSLAPVARGVGISPFAAE